MFKVNWEFKVNWKVQQLREKNPSLNAVFFSLFFFFFFFYTSASYICGVIKLLMYLYGIDRICTADAV